MPSFRYRLTPTGWIGAALFVLPTPVGIWAWSNALQRFALRGSYDKAIEELRGVAALPDISVPFIAALATASLVGLVMVIVGREAVST